MYTLYFINFLGGPSKTTGPNQPVQVILSGVCCYYLPYPFSLLHCVYTLQRAPYGCHLYKSEQIAWSAHLLSLLALFLLQPCLPKQRNSSTKQLHQNPTLTSPSRGSSDRISASRLPLAFKPFNFSHQQGLILAALRDREASGLFTWAGRREWAIRMSWGEMLADSFAFARGTEAHGHDEAIY